MVVAPQRSRSPAATVTRHVDAGGSLVSAAIVAGSVAVMVTWPAGLAGDLLLAATALGLLVAAPHTVPVWSALTLLAATALALIAANTKLAELFADLVYFCLVIACLWAGWGLLLERTGWLLPLRALHVALAPRAWYGALPAALAGAAIAAGALAALVVVRPGPAGILATVAAVGGLVLGARFMVACWCTLTLALAAGVTALLGATTMEVSLLNLVCLGLVVTLAMAVRDPLARLLGWPLPSLGSRRHRAPAQAPWSDPAPSGGSASEGAPNA